MADAGKDPVPEFKKSIKISFGLSKYNNKGVTSKIIE